MLFELAIIPVGDDAHTSNEIAQALELIEASGLPYQLTPAATCIEGSWDEVMVVIRRCHERVRTMCPHVITTIKIEDDAGAQDKLTQNIVSVEEKVGRPLRTTPPLAGGARADDSPSPIPASAAGELGRTLI